VTEYIGTPPSFLSPSRVMSALVAVGYAVAGYCAGGISTGLEVFGCAVLPVACIWFPDALGSYVGWWGTTHITRPSPELAVAFMGWVVLLLPVLVIPLIWLASQ
jgi:hypothetical protein